MSNDHRALPSVWTILKTLRWTTDYFHQHGIDTARSDAEVLLAHALKCNRIDLYLYHDQPLQSEELSRFKGMIRRRAQREPVAYITGFKEFWSLDFRVTSDVLIPRPETEELVASALHHCFENERLRVLELGTGSGAISVALAHERPHWQFWASDTSIKSIEIARMNTLKHKQERRIAFWVGNWFAELGGQGALFDLVVSNPPYISQNDIQQLEPEVRQYEPALALDGGPDGLDCIELIINRAHGYLKPGGRLLLEIGYDQGKTVETLGRAAGRYDQVNIESDLSGHDRRLHLQKALS